MNDQERQKHIQNKFRAFKYTVAVFIIVIFLWWLQGGHLLSFLRPQPSPAEITITTTANIFKTGLANIYSFFVELFR
ncbi:MAG: hypothetical protein NZ866_01885 [Patescibacteria group bacterium]|nr:hypothetical protein [Patescibacteria group bacterium]